MTINWIQATLLGFFACLSALTGAGGTTLGNYTLGRPLVGGLICGLIMHDVYTGVLAGCAIQVVFIALTTPGCIATADVRAISYIGIPLSILAIHTYGLDPATYEGSGLAAFIGALVGTCGTILCDRTIKINSRWVKKGWEAIQEHKYHEAYKVNMLYPWIGHFIYSFLPTFIICKFGHVLIGFMQTNLPIDCLVMKTILMCGIMLPCVGIATVLQVMINKPIEFIPYFFGFTIALGLGISLFSCTMIAAMFGLIRYRINYLQLKYEEEISNSSRFVEEDDYEEGI